MKGKKKYLGIRLSEEEIEVIERIKEARGHETISDAIREMIRFINVYFDDRVTVEKGFKPHILKLAKENFEVFKGYPIADLFKSVPELERVVKNE